MCSQSHSSPVFLFGSTFSVEPNATILFSVSHMYSLDFCFEHRRSNDFIKLFFSLNIKFSSIFNDAALFSFDVRFGFFSFLLFSVFSISTSMSAATSMVSLVSSVFLAGRSMSILSMLVVSMR
uniref:Uncharacterized protein n=1 Tax=Cacopsylla melanoneura TaxID=428564 RepID=A0A8D8QSY7_9HEMI